MEITTAFTNTNWISVILAALSTFLIGGIWYGPLFGKLWIREFGFSEDELAKRNIKKTFGFSFLLACFASLVLDMIIGSEANVTFGAWAGFFAGIGWVSTFLGILYLFENRSLKAFFINAGYCTVSLTLMGTILGAL